MITRAALEVTTRGRGPNIAHPIQLEAQVEAARHPRFGDILQFCNVAVALQPGFIKTQMQR